MRELRIRFLRGDVRFVELRHVQQRELLRSDRAVGDDTMPSRKLLRRRIGHHWVLCLRALLCGVSKWLLHLSGGFDRR